MVSEQMTYLVVDYNDCSSDRILGNHGIKNISFGTNPRDFYSARFVAENHSSMNPDHQICLEEYDLNGTISMAWLYENGITRTSGSADNVRFDE